MEKQGHKPQFKQKTKQAADHISTQIIRDIHFRLWKEQFNRHEFYF